MTNNKIAFFPYLIVKDFVSLIAVIFVYLCQCYIGTLSLSHPDNALEACALITPSHIVPEWYFLCQYAMLKALPNKNAGFVVLLTSILLLTSLLESCSLSRSFANLFMVLYILLLGVGSQLPLSHHLALSQLLDYL